MFRRPLFCALALFAASLFPSRAGSDLGLNALPDVSIGTAPAPKPIQYVTLPEVINQALKNNLDIRYSKLDVTVAEAQLRGAAGDFDPTIDLQSTYEYSLTPQNALDFAATNGVAGAQRNFEQENWRNHLTLQGKLPTGTSYSFGVTSDRLTNTLDRSSSFYFTPEYQTFVGVQARQALLKNFGTDVNLAAIRIGRISKKISQFTWRAKVIDSISSVNVSYYALLFAVENLRLKQEAVQADQQLLEQNRRRLQLGFMSPIDVRQAEVAVSSDQEDVLTALNYLQERQFDLKRQIIGDIAQDLGRDLRPAGRLTALPIPAQTRSQLLSLAFKNRNDYQASFQQIERENIRVRYAKNQLYPALDLIGSYGLNGLRNEYDAGFSAAFSDRTPSWSIGLEASFPIGNTTARAQLAQVQATKAQALNRLKQTELQVALDVDTAISRIQTNQQRVLTAGNSTRLAQEALKIAGNQLGQGLISSFDVIEQKKKLDEARTRELQSTADLNVSIVQLWVATGTLLDEQKIQIKD